MIGDEGQPFRVSALVPGQPGLPFAGYQKLYIGGSTSPFNDGTWVRENPREWHTGRLAG